MRIIHLSDLHIGKRLNGFSMIEDQEYILTNIINIIDEQNPQAVIIAGDVYDKPYPPAEAVELFDRFLSRLAKRNLKVFVISGNHDSAERIAFGSSIMDKSGVYMSPVFAGKVEPVVLEDEFGKLNFYMLPFVKPTHVNRYYEGREAKSYTEAIKLVVDDMKLNTSERNILITHQFVTGSLRSESEEISVGGSDNVDSCVFNDFDYVALGHIHKPQKCGREVVRYSGTPLKYSFSEANDEKSVTVVEMKGKGETELTFIPLKPKHDLVEIKGKYDEIIRRDFYENTTYGEDYLHITLTDEEDVPDAISKLRVVYKNIMKLDYDNTRTRHMGNISGASDVENKSPLELFEQFYQEQYGVELSDEKKTFVGKIIEEIWENRE